MKSHIYKSFALIFALVFLAFGTPTVFAAKPALVESVDELTAALMNAEDGDTILVGDITFNPMPMGMILVQKNVTIKSGKDTNAVFTNATFALNGTRNDSSPLSVRFENIDFRGDRFGIPADPESPPTISTELPGIMQTMCAAIFKMNVDAAFKGCSFEGYHYGYGGVFNAIYPADDYKNTLKLTLDDCSFRNNAAKYGGAVYLSGYGHNISFKANGCVFDGNLAATGGAVWAQDADVRLFDCTLSQNGYLDAKIEKPDGGALALLNCSAELDGCLVSENVSGGSGAGLFCEIAPFKTVIVKNCTLIGNKSPKDEGAAVVLARTNFDTTAKAYFYFSSLLGKQDLGDNAKIFGCLLVDENAAFCEPSEENGYTLKLNPSDALKKGLDPTIVGHASLPGNEYPIPKDATCKLAGGYFSESLGKLRVGDNYEKEAVVTIEETPGHTKTVTLRYGDRITLEEPVRKGFAFTGWEYPKGTLFEGDGVYIGGTLPDGKLTARWRFVLSKNLYVVWVPVLVIALGLFGFILLKKKKAPVPPAENVKEEAESLPDDWIERVCEKPEITGNISKREMDVLKKLLEGKSRKQIADELFVTEATIKKHSASIYAKLGVHNRTELIYKLTKQ